MNKPTEKRAITKPTIAPSWTRAFWVGLIQWLGVFSRKHLRNSHYDDTNKRFFPPFGFDVFVALLIGNIIGTLIMKYFVF